MKTIDTIVGKAKPALLGIAALAITTLAGCQTGEYSYNKLLVENRNEQVNGQASSSTYTFSEAKGPFNPFGERKRAYQLTIESSDGRHIALLDKNTNGVMDHGDRIIVSGTEYAVLGGHAYAADAWPENKGPISETLNSAADTYATIAAKALQGGGK